MRAPLGCFVFRCLPPPTQRGRWMHTALVTTHGKTGWASSTVLNSHSPPARRVNQRPLPLTPQHSLAHSSGKEKTESHTAQTRMQGPPTRLECSVTSDKKEQSCKPLPPFLVLHRDFRVWHICMSRVGPQPSPASSSILPRPQPRRFETTFVIQTKASHHPLPVELCRWNC
jgi:hypothetical protein